MTNEGLIDRITKVLASHQPISLGRSVRCSCWHSLGADRALFHPRQYFRDHLAPLVAEVMVDVD